LFPFAPFLFVPCPPSRRRLGIGFHELVERFITVDRPTTNTALFSPVFYLVKGRQAGRQADRQAGRQAGSRRSLRNEKKRKKDGRREKGAGMHAGRGKRAGSLARARARARARQQKRADVAGLFYGLLVRNGNGETALKNIHAL